MQDTIDDQFTITLDDEELSCSGAFDIVLCQYDGGEVSLDEQLIEWIKDKNTYLDFKTEWSTLHESRYARMDHIFLPDPPELEKVQLLAAFYRKKQEEVLANRHVIADNFWDWFMDDVQARQHPFYGPSPGGPYEPYILPALMPTGPFADNDELWRAIRTTWVDGLAGLEGMRRNLPMIDTDALLGTVYPQELVLEGDVLTFQLSSDVCDGQLLCSTYAEIHRDYSFQDWHNN